MLQWAVIMKDMELKKAFFIVWLVLSVIILLTLATPFLFSPETINRFKPKCEWKEKYNKECPFCGMTRSFILISEGKISKADRTNKFSIYLYTLFIINEIAVTCIISRTYLFKAGMRPFGKA